MTTQLSVQVRTSTFSRRFKFILGTLIIFLATGYLIFSATRENAQYYLTVEELLSRSDTLGDRIVRVSGAVVGETIQYDPQTLELTFTIAHMPGDPGDIDKAGGLAAAIRSAVSNPDAPRLKVYYVGPKPDLLRPEAAAIVTGRLGQDGVFYADEVLFKCPTRYDEAPPAGPPQEG